MKYKRFPGFAGEHHCYAVDIHMFDFLSLGIRGPIPKRVFFMPTLSSDVYDLSFGDIGHDGDVNIHSITGNGDHDTVLMMIQQVIENYTEVYPDRWIFFHGSTPERIRLFRMKIWRQLEQLRPSFHIYGEIDRQFIPFRRNMPLSGFLIRRKMADEDELQTVPRYYNKGSRIWMKGE